MEPFDKNANLPPNIPTTQAGPSTQSPQSPLTPPPSPFFAPPQPATSPVRSALPPTDIPPELRPYYTDPARRSGRWTQVRLFILPAVVFIVVLGLLIGGTLWLRHHTVNDIFGRGAKTPSLTQPTPIDPVQPAAPQSVQPTTPETTTSTPSVPSSQASDQTPTPASNPATTVPKTGPGEAIFVISLLMAITAGIAHSRLTARRLNSHAK